MKYDYDALVFIGRFQPCHLGHKSVIDEALRRAKEVVVVVGSSFAARNIRNPFTFEERRTMIQSVYDDDSRSRLRVVPVSDYPYDDNKWINAIQNQVKNVVPDAKNIGLIGHSKDHTSYYLNIFPNWGNVDVPNFADINASDIRKMLFENGMPENIAAAMPSAAYSEMSNFILANATVGGVWDTLIKEYDTIKFYKEAWSVAPYAPTFVTVDAVVVQSGHVLLVQRGAMPGKGLLALPGGFLNQEETMLEGAIRELREETKIKVPAPVLRGSVKESKTFDAPHRSTRGRTITQAFFIDLGTGKLPKVKGSDDAAKAFWVPFDEVRQETLFEDHFHILDTFVPIG